MKNGDPIRWVIAGALLACLAFAGFGRASAQAPGFAQITSPGGGEAVRGLVTIEGFAAHPRFERYELAFAYPEDPTDTWFAIGEPSRQPVEAGPLGLWDTSSITDGSYRLRLRVFLDNGTALEHIVEGLRIRNYSQIETPTAAAVVAPLATPTAAPPTPTPRPTPLPPFDRGGAKKLVSAFTAGMILGGISLAGGLAYLALRRSLHLRRSALRMRRMRLEAERKQRGRR